MFQLLHRGPWRADQVKTTWTDQSMFDPAPEVRELIEQTWAQESARPGIHLFDGPMCRVERIDASPARLLMTFSPISYKPFLAGNLHHASFAAKFGPASLPNPLGLSTLVQTGDGYWMLGRRNARVAYYPSRVHPFAGSLEPAEANDLFAGVQRELSEELDLSPADLSDILCIGIASDDRLIQPEAIFHAITPMSLAQVSAQLDPAEHSAVWCCRAEARSVAEQWRSPQQVEQFTPIALATLVLAGGLAFGDQWQQEQLRVLGARG